MNKKYTALLTAALLMLSACSLNPAAPAEPAATETPASTAELTPAPTAEPTPEPTASPEPEGAYFTRAGEGELPGYTPAEGYSQIMPYWDGTAYGLFDIGGVVVTDPVYDSVSMLSYKDMLTGETCYLKVWLLQQGGGLDEGEDGLLIIGEAASFGAVSLDGSLALDCVYDEVYAVGPDAFICTRIVADGDSCSWSVYGSDGSLLLSSTDEAVEAKQTVATPYTVQRSGEGWIMELADGFWYFDGEKNAVAGPYKYLTPFVGEYCVARTGETEYELLNRSFGSCLEGTGSCTLGMLEGGYILMEDGTLSTVLDSSLNTVLTTQAAGISPAAYGFSLMSLDGEETKYTFCNAEGELLDAYNDGKHYPVEGSALIYTVADGSTVVTNPVNGASVTLAGEYEVLPFWVEGSVAPGGIVAAYSWNEDYTANAACLISADCVVLTGGENISFEAVQDPVTGAYCIEARDNDLRLTALYRVEEGGLAELPCGEDYQVSYIDGVSLAVNSLWFTARDAESTLLLRLPLTTE